jgi:hypothetical protein
MTAGMTARGSWSSVVSALSGAFLVFAAGWYGNAYASRADLAALEAKALEARAAVDSLDRVAAAWADSAARARARVERDTVVLTRTVVEWRTLLDTAFIEVPATPRESTLVASCGAVVASCEQARASQAAEAEALRGTLFAERDGRAAERDAAAAAFAAMEARARRARVLWSGGSALAAVILWEIIR